MLSVVQRSFRSERAHGIGEVVDTSGWRLERQLRDQGFIRPATESEIAEASTQTRRKPAEAIAAGAGKAQPAPRARKSAKPKAASKRRGK